MGDHWAEQEVDWWIQEEEERLWEAKVERKKDKMIFFMYRLGILKYNPF